MKKIILIMLLLIALTSILLAEDIQLQEISLDEFLTEYLPDYKIEKQIQLEGIGRDFAVAKETGEIVAVIENGDLFYLNFFDKQGNKRWSKTFEKEYYIRCAISQNGKTISLHIGSKKAHIKNIIINRDGNILFESEKTDSYLIPSPQGDYLYSRNGMFYLGPEKYIELYDLHGNNLSWDKSDKYNLTSSGSGIRFIDIHSCMLYYSTSNGDYISYCKIEDNKIDTIWETAIPKQMFSSAFFDNRMTAFFKNKIAFIGTNYVFCSDLRGNKLYESEGYFQSVDFISEDKILLMNESCTRIVNLDNLEIANINFSLKYPNIKDNYADRFISIEEINSNYILSIDRNQTHTRRFRTFITTGSFLPNHTFYLNEEFNKYTVNGFDFVVFFKYGSNPNVLVLRENHYEH